MKHFEYLIQFPSIMKLSFLHPPLPSPKSEYFINIASLMNKLKSGHDSLHFSLLGFQSQ